MEKYIDFSKPYFIGIAGGTASGKSTLCEEIIKGLSLIGECTVLCMDNFYKDLTEEQMANLKHYNFDHPDSLDFDEMLNCISQMIDYKDVEIPDYDFTTNCRKKEKILVKKSHFILFEGILALYDTRITELMDFKIFVTEDDDVRLMRRVKRDILSRGRTTISVLERWHLTVKPSFDQFVKGTMKKADIAVNGNANNWRAVNFIVYNLKNILGEYIRDEKSKKSTEVV